MTDSQSNGASHGGERRYRRLFENTPICIFVADLTVIPAVILEVNRRAELVYGYTAAEMVGNPADRLVPEECRANVQNIVERVQRGETVVAEATNRRRDGTTFPVRVIATLDAANSGQVIVTVEDITAEKQRRSPADAVDAERIRIAHEIHDAVVQSLGELRFQSALWPHLTGGAAPPAMRGGPEELQVVLAAAIGDMRRAIFALRPVDLDTLGLFPALAQLVVAFGEQNQAIARFDASGPRDRLPASYKLPLFRIVQHGLLNIGQHARANSVLVSLNVGAAGGVTLSLRDNGRGFHPGLAGGTGHSGHFGLRQMRERIMELGGTLDIRSAIGQGTELLITLPSAGKGAYHATG